MKPSSRTNADELARERLVALLHVLTRHSHGASRALVTELLRAYYRPASHPVDGAGDPRVLTGTEDGHDALLDDIRTLQRMGLDVRNAGTESEQLWVTEADALVALPPTLTPAEEAVIMTALQIFPSTAADRTTRSAAHKLRIDDAPPQPWHVDTGLDAESWHVFYECRAARRFVHLTHRASHDLETIVAQPWSIVEVRGRYAGIVRPVGSDARLIWLDEIDGPIRPATQAEHRSKNEVGAWEPNPMRIHALVREAQPHEVSAVGHTTTGAPTTVAAQEAAALPARALRHGVILDDHVLRERQRELLHAVLENHS